jgi:hypothetical protein
MSARPPDSAEDEIVTRTLGQLGDAERAGVVSSVHAEAQAAGWHRLTAQQKGALYAEWARRFDLKHSALKDGIMKGFDAAQHIPPSGEAAVHERLKAALAVSPVPYWCDKVTLWKGRARADFVLGFSPHLLTHAAELEPAPSWQFGMSQALWYKSAHFHETGLQVLPTLILFGNVTMSRWQEIKTTCLDQRVLLLTISLFVGDDPAPFPIDKLLGVTLG